MVFLGTEQEDGTNSKELSKAFQTARLHGLLRKMDWSGGFDMMIQRIAYEKQRKASMEFILEAKTSWSKVSARSFLAFLEQYGFKI